MANKVKTNEQEVVSKSQTIAEKTWEEIKDKKLSLFSLPDQFVHTYYKPRFVEQNNLYLSSLTQASSALLALEEAIAPKYKASLVDKYIVISLV